MEIDSFVLNLVVRKEQKGNSSCPLELRENFQQLEEQEILSQWVMMGILILEEAKGNSHLLEEQEILNQQELRENFHQLEEQETLNQ